MSINSYKINFDAASIAKLINLSDLNRLFFLLYWQSNKSNRVNFNDTFLLRQKEKQ